MRWSTCRKCGGILTPAFPFDHAVHRIALKAWQRRHIDGSTVNVPMHDDLCESANIHGHATPCWCEERARLSAGHVYVDSGGGDCEVCGHYFDDPAHIDGSES